MTTGRSSRLRAESARVCALLAACAIFPMLYIVLRRSVDVPYWDEWAWADFAYGVHTHTLTFAQLWETHAEHRVLGDNLLMVALDLAGGWSVVREEVLSLVFLAATQLLVWLLIRRTAGPLSRDMVFAAATLLLFGFAQSENFASGYQMAWFVCNLCAVGVSWALSCPARRRGHVVLAFAAAAFAGITSSQGLVVWLTGAVVIVLLDRRRPSVLFWTWLACGALTAAVVRFGAWPGDPATRLGLPQLPALISFALAYLGAPLARSFGASASAAAGAVVLAAIAAAAVAALRMPAAARVRIAPWLALAAYASVCALLTASGRGGSGIAIALSSRYTSIAEYAWIAALGALAVMLPRVTARRAVVATAAACAVIACGSIVQSVWANYWWVLAENQLRTARAQLANGQLEAVRLIDPDAAAVTREFGRLAHVHDGLFSEP